MREHARKKVKLICVSSRYRSPGRGDVSHILLIFDYWYCPKMQHWFPSLPVSRRELDDHHRVSIEDISLWLEFPHPPSCPSLCSCFRHSSWPLRFWGLLVLSFVPLTTVVIITVLIQLMSVLSARLQATELFCLHRICYPEQSSWPPWTQIKREWNGGWTLWPVMCERAL